MELYPKLLVYSGAIGSSLMLGPMYNHSQNVWGHELTQAIPKLTLAIPKLTQAFPQSQEFKHYLCAFHWNQKNVLVTPNGKHKPPEPKLRPPAISQM